jgi:hypothetical protein
MPDVLVFNLLGFDALSAPSRLVAADNDLIDDEPGSDGWGPSVESERYKSVIVWILVDYYTVNLLTLCTAVVASRAADTVRAPEEHNEVLPC